jgi:hypothetical protein
MSSSIAGSAGAVLHQVVSGKRAQGTIGPLQVRAVVEG